MVEINTLSIFIVIIGLVIAFLIYFFERKTKNEIFILNKKKEVIEKYLKQLSSIENSSKNSYEKLNQLKDLSKKIFSDYYGINPKDSYENIIKYFDSKGNHFLKRFAEVLADYSYRQRNIDNKTLSELFLILRREIFNVPYKN